MRIRKVKIEIKSLVKSLNEFAETFEKVRKGEYVEPKEVVSFTNFDVFRSFFTDKRMQLLKIIKEKKPKSIYQLAKLAKRNYKNVYDDVKLLKYYGLVTNKDNKVRTDFDKIEVDVVF
ncbi:MAG: hypothetical protein V1740_04995 [Candidatus Woesearchaeota archaeon]